MERFTQKPKSELERVTEIIHDIEEALDATNFYEGDRSEVEENLEYYRERREALLGRRSLELAMA